MVNSNVPFLICLDFFKKYTIFVNSVSNQLCAPFLDEQIPLICNCGHVYLELKNEDTILFTRQNRMKLHQNFSHPTAEKLYNLLIIACLLGTEFQTKQLLEKIVRHFDIC